MYWTGCTVSPFERAFHIGALAGIVAVATGIAVGWIAYGLLH